MRRYYLNVRKRLNSNGWRKERGRGEGRGREGEEGVHQKFTYNLKRYSLARSQSARNRRHIENRWKTTNDLSRQLFPFIVDLFEKNKNFSVNKNKRNKETSSFLRIDHRTVDNMAAIPRDSHNLDFFHIVIMDFSKSAIYDFIEFCGCLYQSGIC